MNRRKEPIAAQTQKEVRKEAKEGLSTDTVALSPPTKRVPVSAPRKVKKTSKRTTPSEKIEDSVPAHIHGEGSRWVTMLKRQTEENNLRIRKQEQKRN